VASKRTKINSSTVSSKSLLWAIFVVALSILGIVSLQYFNSLKTPTQTQSNAATVSTNYLVTLNQPSPSFNDSVNFTAIYPKVATRKVGPREPFNPLITVSCASSADGSTIYRTTVISFSQTTNKDGTITGVSNYITLGGTSSSGGTTYDWTGGAALCNAYLMYTDSSNITHVLANTQFSVN